MSLPPSLKSFAVRLAGRRFYILATGLTIGFASLTEANPKPTSSPTPSWKWVASWTTAAQGVLESQPGTPAPNLSFSIPDFSIGAQEQTLRLIIKPDLWESQARIRLTNIFGTQPVTFGSVTVA